MTGSLAASVTSISETYVLIASSSASRPRRRRMHPSNPPAVTATPVVRRARLLPVDELRVARDADRAFGVTQFFLYLLLKILFDLLYADSIKHDRVRLVVHDGFHLVGVGPEAGSRLARSLRLSIQSVYVKYCTAFGILLISYTTVTLGHGSVDIVQRDGTRFRRPQAVASERSDERQHYEQTVVRHWQTEPRRDSRIIRRIS